MLSTNWTRIQVLAFLSANNKQATSTNHNTNPWSNRLRHESTRAKKKFKRFRLSVNDDRAFGGAAVTVAIECR
jgi:hypothetical protein